MNPDKLTEIHVIGNEVALKWEDGSESFFPIDFLRAQSPSAENMGEADIFGTVYGGTPGKSFSGTGITNWEWIGNYAVRFEFTDGHRTGIYSFAYLKELESKLPPQG